MLTYHAVRAARHQRGVAPYGRALRIARAVAAACNAGVSTFWPPARLPAPLGGRSAVLRPLIYTGYTLFPCTLRPEVERPCVSAACAPDCRCGAMIEPAPSVSRPLTVAVSVHHQVCAERSPTARPQTIAAVARSHTLHAPRAFLRATRLVG